MSIVSMWLWPDLFSALKFKMLLRYFHFNSYLIYQQLWTIQTLFIHIFVFSGPLLSFKSFGLFKLCLFATVFYSDNLEKTTTTFWLRFNLFLGTKFVSSGIGLLVQSIKPKKFWITEISCVILDVCIFVVVNFLNNMPKVLIGRVWALEGGEFKGANFMCYVIISEIMDFSRKKLT